MGLSVLKDVIRKAEERGKECSICGELAGNLKFTKLLLGIGLRNLSVQPALIPYIKYKIIRLLRNGTEQSSVKDRLRKHHGIKKAPSEKESMQELAQSLARADDDGFALPEKIRGIHLLIS